jgi:hypothetical protein
MAFAMRARLRRLAARFDLLVVIEIDCYFILQSVLPDNRRMVIHLMSNRFSSTTTWRRLRGRPPARFILMDPSNSATFVERRAATPKPATSAVDGFERTCAGDAPLPSAGRVKIGIFIRLGRQRPIEMFFYCLRDM